MANFTIRRANQEDSEAILRCLHTAFAPFKQFYSAEGYRDTTLTEEMLRQRFRTMSLYVAESKTGEVIGTIACNVLSAEEGHIRGMAVLEAWQGRGVAQALLEAVLAELSARGCAFISLDTTAPLQRAMGFYERNGFTRSGKIGDHFGMPLYEYVKQLG